MLINSNVGTRMTEEGEQRKSCTRVRTPVALLRSLLDKYPWERYEPLILPCKGKILPLVFF